MRDSYLSQNAPEVKNALDAAEAATFSSYQKFGQGISKDMLVFGRDGNLRFTNGQTLQGLLKEKDLPSVRDFSDVVKAYPQAKDQVNQLLLAVYRRDYTQNGVPTARKHAKFLKDYGNVIGEFFNPQDRAKILSLGGLAEVVGTEYQTLRKFMPKLKGALGGEMETVGPEDVIERVLQNSWEPKQMRFAIDSLKDYPYRDQVLRSWKSGVTENLYKGLLDPKTGDINFDRVDKLLAGKNKDKIALLFNTAASKDGDKIVRGLEALRDGKRIVAQKSVGGLAPHMATALSDLARITYARPLSREGVMVSALQRSRRRAAPEAVYNALTNPDEMERLAKQVNTLKAQIIGAAAVGSLNTY
jgi:hypothetical protein